MGKKIEPSQIAGQLHPVRLLRRSKHPGPVLESPERTPKRYRMAAVVKGYKGITEYSFDERAGYSAGLHGQIKDGKVNVIKTVKGNRVLSAEC